MRYYEQLGLIGNIERDENGYRQYSESDIAWFQIIKYFRAMGMPIRDMQQFLTSQNGEVSTLTVRREFIGNYRRKVIDQMRELEETLEKIDYKINFLKRLEGSDTSQQE